MKKAILLIFLIVNALCSFAENRIKSIEVDVVLRKDGSATITEHWDVEQYENT